ncbi:hypothetical protein RFI_23415 [Reticulomyxa filosa]|uniref:Uncharacterized protein n=1 Tax=Reticulomyxa filosa TaxID=46433 RepID=X6MIX8_RETFI|nr:hypothetical protein RFI_23415 [Reticulomyxa filosa]|eukprot:ETO13953.1 hypothetical protein RFI_23415 [Reticulomyxa filosa]
MTEQTFKDAMKFIEKRTTSFLTEFSDQHEKNLRQENLLKDLPEKTDKNGLYLCHMTSYFPQNGIIYPRHANFKIVKDPIAIVIPFTSIQERILGGFIEDIIIFGPLSLPDNSIILIHENRKSSIQKYIDILPGNIEIEYFEGELENALKTLFERKNTEYLQVVEPIRTNSFGSAFCGRFGDQKITSHSFFASITRPLCLHFTTAFDTVEDIFMNKKGFDSLNNAQIALFLRGLKTSISRTFSAEAINLKFLNKWENLITKARTIVKLASPTNIDYSSMWEKTEKEITEYDYYSREEPAIPPPPSLDLLRLFTNLPFKSYYGCHHFVIESMQYVF